jgi:hypothetical protein
MTSPEVRDAASRLVARTCEAQGVPALIADAAALARLATLMAPVAAERAASNHKTGGSAALGRDVSPVSARASDAPPSRPGHRRPRVTA